ncbi:MAG TPA: cytochrome c maturation protein CcmE [Acidimicrobiia bacterium]|nr:cytochrome c maturation protein CcmE [Acidimicrobiia bacterium]
MEVIDQPPVPVPVLRARPKPKRLRYLVAGGLCAAAVLFLVVGGLSRNIVYFRTVSEAVRAHDGAPADGGRLRMAGAVVTGSVVRQADGVAFKVTEGGVTASVFHHGDPPELFKDGAPVVCEGRWQGDSFASDRIMIKHGSEYKPPPVDANPAR